MISKNREIINKFQIIFESAAVIATSRKITDFRAKQIVLAPSLLLVLFYCENIGGTSHNRSSEEHSRQITHRKE